MHKIVFQHLRQISLFADIDDSVLHTVASSARLFALPRLTTIFLAGDVASELYFVISGSVKRALISSDGYERVIAILTAGQMFGEAELFGFQRHSSTATTLEQSVMIGLDYTALRLMIKKDMALGLRFIEALAQRQLDSDADLANSMIVSVSERVLDFMLKQIDEPLPRAKDRDAQARVFLPATKKVIASRIGITPETLSRALRELSEAGLVSVHRNEITINLSRVEARMRQQQTAETGLPLWRRDSRRRRGWTNNEANVKDVSLRVVNKSGLQRMLSQRMARSWVMLSQQLLPGLATDTLQRSIALFERYLYDLSLVAMQSESRAAHDELRTLWQHYKRVLSVTSDSHDLAQISAMSDEVMHAAHALTNELVLEMATDSARFIEVFGRQRMLSQRLVKDYLSMNILNHRDHVVGQLDRTREEFESNLLRIRGSVPEGDAVVTATMAKIEAIWQRLIHIIDQSADADITQNAELAIRLGDTILDHVDHTIARLQSRAM